MAEGDHLVVPFSTAGIFTPKPHFDDVVGHGEKEASKPSFLFVGSCEEVVPGDLQENVLDEIFSVHFGNAVDTARDLTRNERLVSKVDRVPSSGFVVLRGADLGPDGRQEFHREEYSKMELLLEELSSGAKIIAEFSFFLPGLSPTCNLTSEQVRNR